MPGSDYHLLTFDVVSLYTSIPVSDAIRAVTDHLTRTGTRASTVCAVADALSLILGLSYLQFAGSVYLQLAGLAMGTPCAPAVAQIFMYELERVLLRRTPACSSPCVFRRYIDDGFLLWTGSVASLCDFLGRMRLMHPCIRFTFDHQRDTIVFLDLRIWRGEHGLGWSPFVKPLNRFEYIPRFSSHPPHVARGWILTELLRLRRNSSTATAYRYARHGFYRRLRMRGHTVSFLNRVFDEGDQYEPRQDSTSGDSPLYLVLPFLQGYDPAHFARVVRTWHEANTPGIPVPGVAFSSPPSLGRLLVRARHSVPRSVLDL